MWLNYNVKIKIFQYNLYVQSCKHHMYELHGPVWLDNIQLNPCAYQNYTNPIKYRYWLIFIEIIWPQNISRFSPVHWLDTNGFNWSHKGLWHLPKPLEAILLTKAGKCCNEDVDPACVEVAMLERERIELDLIKWTLK